MSCFAMGIKLFLLFVLCVGVKGQENPLDRCMEMIKYKDGVETFVKLADEEQFNVTCENMKRAFDCLNEVAEERFGQDMRQLALLLQNSEIGKGFQLIVNMMDLIEELCAEGTQLHNDYLMDIHCFRHLNRDSLEKCKREATAASVIYRHLETNNTFDHGNEEPCVMAAYQLGCLGVDILEECGNRALNTYKEIIKKSGIFKIGLCPKDLLQTVNTTIVDSLEKLETRRAVYHTIMALRKRK